ncbi:hypothetical protein MXD81_49235 [Microbacteriaceae bacterium K1510]|nr:hypothetical protein [Microbacteriaceae bacterium K1510]
MVGRTVGDRDRQYDHDQDHAQQQLVEHRHPTAKVGVTVLGGGHSTTLPR